MKIATISKKLDALYEFDREPVSKNALQGIGNFLGSFAGEHVAGTEFVIGMLFVALNQVVGIELYFLPLPAWILAVVLFVLLSKLYQKKNI